MNIAKKIAPPTTLGEKLAQMLQQLWFAFPFLITDYHVNDDDVGFSSSK